MFDRRFEKKEVPFCPDCGIVLTDATDEWEFCPYCGATLNQNRRFVTHRSNNLNDYYLSAEDRADILNS